MKIIIGRNKRQWRPQSKKKERGKILSPGNRKACHSISTFQQYVVEGDIESSMRVRIDFL
jgi:hypothetical protein